MKKTKNESIYIYFYLLRRSFPTSKLFYFIFFGFKFIGLFLFTHNPKGYEDNLFTIAYFLRKLTLFGLLSLNFTSKGYCIVSLIIFGVFFYIIIHSIIIYTKMYFLYKSRYLNQYDFLLNKRRTSRRLKFCTRILGIIIVLIAFLSQYLLEFLTLIVFAVVYENQIFQNSAMFDTEKSVIFRGFYSKAIIPPIGLCIINIISIIMINITLFLFFIMNSTKALWLNTGFNGYSNKIIVILLILLFMFQSINSVQEFFTEKFGQTHKIIINIIAVCLLSLFLLSHVKKFNHYYSIIPKFNLFICVWCWYSGILEILIFYICDTPFTQGYSFLKLIVEVTNAVLFTYLILTISNRYFLSLFTNHLFNVAQKNTYIGESYAFIHLLKLVLLNKLPQHLELVSMIYSHKSKCSTIKCPCNKLFKDRDNGGNEINFKEKLIIVGEQDLVNRIHELYKKTKGQSYPIADYCILHVGYIYEIKQHLTFALYLASKYLNSVLRLGLITKCFLYEFQKQIMKEFFKRRKHEKKQHLIYFKSLNISGTFDYLNYLNKQKERNSANESLKKFYNYIIFIDNIKKLINICCNGLESILMLRSSLQNNSKLGSTMNKNQYENFINSCEIIKINNDKLVKLITQQMKGEIFCHSELSYLLTNYFDMIYKKVPQNIQRKYISMHYICEISKNENLRDYLKYNIKNPLIIEFTKNDSFIIDYISTDLCEKLEYNKANLIGKDIHELIPVEIVPKHKLFMKQFLFIQNASMTKDTFVLTSTHNIINIQVVCKVLPNISNPFFFIIDMQVINHKSLSSFVYFLILNNDLNILAVNKRFEEQFFFNIKMIEMLKVNFCGFFGQNQAKFVKRMKEQFKKCKHKKLEDENNAISILTNIKQEKIFSYRRIKNTLNSSHNYLKDIIKKEQVISGLSHLIKIVNDLGLDIEWYNRVRFLGERIKMSMDRVLPHQMNTYYDVIYFLKQIGNQRYYIIKMTENTNVRSILNHTLYMHESLMKQRIAEIPYNIDRKETNSLVKNCIKMSQSSKSIQKVNNCLSVNLDNTNIENNPKYLIPKSKIVNFIENSSSQSQVCDSEIMPQSSTSKYALLQKQSLYMTRNSKQDYSTSIDNNLIFGGFTKNLVKKKLSIGNASSSPNVTNEFIINESKRLLMYASYNKLSKRYTLYFYSTSLILIILMIIFIIFKSIIMNMNKSLFYINAYSSMIKADIFFGAIINIANCIQKEPLNPQKIDIASYDILVQISDDLIEHYSLFSFYINSFISNSNIGILLNIINEIDSYEYLQKDWSTKMMNSSLTEIIYIFRISFSSNIITSGRSKCRLKEMFYEEKFKLIEDFTGVENSSVEEQLLFLNIYNLMNKIMPKFELLLLESTRLLFDYHDYFSNIVCVYNIVIWVVTIWLLFVLIRKVIFDQKLTKTICSYIYAQNSQEEKDEQRLLAFKDILQDFSKKKIAVFEGIKNRGINVKNYNHILFTKININSKDVIASPLNQISKHRIPKKSLRLQIQNTKQSKNIIQPSMLNSVLWIIICMIIIVSVIEIMSVLTSLFWEKNIIFSISIAIDFLERIPILNKLLFYTEISAVVNNVDFIPNDLVMSSAKEKYLNYYKKAIDINQNTQVKFLGNSLYSTLYYEASVIKENLMEFMNRKKKGLTSVKFWETKFNEKNGICLYGYLAREYNSLAEFTSILEFYEHLSDFVKICRIQSESISFNDLDSSIDYFMQGLTNIYYDFAKKEKSIQRIDWFLYQQSQYQKNFDYPMKLAFQTYSYFLLIDLDDLHTRMISNDFLLTLILLISILIIFAYSIIGIIRKSAHYKSLLIFFVNLAFTPISIDLRLYDQ